MCLAFYEDPELNLTLQFVDAHAVKARVAQNVKWPRLKDNQKKVVCRSHYFDRFGGVIKVTHWDGFPLTYHLIGVE